VTESPLDVGNHSAGIGFIPTSIEVLGHDPELDDEIAGKILRLDLAALFPPQPQQSPLILARDDPSVRAAYKRPSKRMIRHEEGFPSSE
jgi:hypothetical protein